MRLLGIKMQRAMDYEKNFCSAEIIEDDESQDGRLGFQVQEEDVSAEQILAAFIRKMNQNFESHSHNVCLTYPSYLERKGIEALYTACRIAKIDRPILVSESRAIVASYANE